MSLPSSAADLPPPPQTLLTIPRVTATHVLPVPIELASGELDVLLLPPTVPSTAPPIVTLTLGARAWALDGAVKLRVADAKEEHRSFVFVPKGVEEGVVKLTFPPSKNQDEWEETEKALGRLEEVLEGRGVLERVDEEGWAAQVGRRASQVGGGHIASTTPGESTVSPTAHSMADSAIHYTATARTAAASLASGIASYAASAGSYVGGLLPKQTGAADEEHDVEAGAGRRGSAGGWEEVKIGASGVGEGTAAVGSAVSDSAHRTIAHHYGEEADSVAQKATQAATNVGAAAYDATLGSSGVYHAGVATHAAATSGPPAVPKEEKPAGEGAGKTEV